MRWISWIGQSAKIDLTGLENEMKILDKVQSYGRCTYRVKLDDSELEMTNQQLVDLADRSDGLIGLPNFGGRVRREEGQIASIIVYLD